MRIEYACGPCSLGVLLVARGSRGICAISLGNDATALSEELRAEFSKADLVPADASFEEVFSRVVAMVERPSQALDLPLEVRGTAFQQRVWEELRKVGAGTTVTYAEIAKAIGTPKAARAVASACAANTLAVAVPCHRVVRQDGSLSGYRWGVERKRQLLREEAGAALVRRDPK